MPGTDEIDSGAAFAELVAQVAASLGEPWRIDTDPAWADHHGRQLIGPQVAGHPARLFFYPPWNRHDRIAIQGSYPRDTAVHSRAAVRVEITVARERGPAVIAREITRRLLPTYLEALAAVAASLAAEDAAKQARRAVATRLGAILSVEPDSHHADPDRDRVHVRVGDAFGHVAIGYSAADVRIELHAVPVAAAKAMLNALVATERQDARAASDTAQSAAPARPQD
jgi:hypothetical protein